MSALMMANHEINKKFGKERAEASIEDFREVLNNLDDLLQKLVRRVHKAKEEYEQKEA